jgi:SAM-dependent methyltransferase
MHQRGESLDTPDPQVEAGLLRIALRGREADRLLDIGCGSGRLLPLLVDFSAKYVGMDLDDRLLHDASSSVPRRSPIALVKADANQLPFSDSSFSSVVMIRLYHRLMNPTAVLKECWRILNPGGTLVVAVYPRPTLSTLIHDVGKGLSDPHGTQSITFSGKGRVEVTSGRNPGFVETLALTQTRLEDIGFRIVRELGSGYEDLPVFRRLPSVFWIRLGGLVREPNGFPCVFIVAERS